MNLATKNMQLTIQQIHNQFKNKLKKQYSKSEIQQLLFIIFEKLIGITKIQVIANPNTPMSNDQNVKISNAMNRLLQNEPIQYIVGETEFYDLTFAVNSSVLIPRPETEELVYWILENYNNPNQKILDIGTGSGCIAITLCKNMKEPEVFALDISSASLEVAKINSAKNNTSIHFIETNILNANFSDLPTELDILISNPPYIKDSEKVLMKANVLDYEPEMALFVNDNDPLIFYRKIAELGKTNLKKNGMLFFEINEASGKEIETLLAKLDYSFIELKKDLYGKYRMIKAVN